MNVTEKLSKNKDIKVEISGMCKMKTERTALVLETPGRVKGTENYAASVPGNIIIHRVHKILLLLGILHAVHRIL